jgi:hypothetical protein
MVQSMPAHFVAAFRPRRIHNTNAPSALFSALELLQLQTVSSHIGLRMRTSPVRIAAIVDMLQRCTKHSSSMHLAQPSPDPSTAPAVQSLKELSAADNRLRSVPDSLCDLPALDKLWLYNNQLTAVPPRLALLPSLTTAWLEANPLSPHSLNSLLREVPASPLCLRSLGIDEQQAAGADQALLLVAGRKVKVGQVAAGGPSTSGYFKLQRAEEAKPGAERMLVVAFGSAPGVPNWGGLLAQAYKADDAEGEAK